MNKQMLQGFWNSFRLHTGVSLRAVAAIPADKLNEKPVTDMRTPKELSLHAFAYLPAFTQAVINGELKGEDMVEPVDEIQTVEDLVKWCEKSWDTANQNFDKLTDEQLSAMVPTPFGQPFPGWMLLTIIYDEHIHHRGQLYTFLRAMGVEPPFLWSFEESDAKFRPQEVPA